MKEKLHLMTNAICHVNVSYSAANPNFRKVGNCDLTKLVDLKNDMYVPTLF